MTPSKYKHRGDDGVSPIRGGETGSSSDSMFLDTSHSEDNNSMVVMMDDCSTTSPAPSSPPPPSSSSSSRRRAGGGGRRSSTSSSESVATASNSSVGTGVTAATTSSRDHPRPSSTSRSMFMMSSGGRRQHQPRESQSRRLFEDDDEDDDEGMDDFKLSPPRALLRTTASTTNTTGEVDEAIPTPFPTTRKRPASSSHSNNDQSHSNSAPSTSTSSMHMSPHLSPNSFLTMDGRFVQSKNPFSSPMPEGDNNYLFASAAAAPSMPAYGATAGAGAALLPPRRHNHHSSYLPQQQQYPRKFCFTGSPIPEHQLHMDPDDHDMMLTTAPTMTKSNNAASAASVLMAPSGGSLAKVRRFNHDDDIVAASGHEMSAIKAKVAALSVDTSTSACTSTAASTTGMNTCAFPLAHDPSPTDVLSFPTPPTPVKAKQPRPKYYNSNTNNNDTVVHHYNRIQQTTVPTTPFVDKRRNPISGAVDSKTPHPPPLHARRARGAAIGTNLPSASVAMDTSASTATSFSRFSNDFDVINELGHGSFGRVYKVLSRLDGCMYAIKAAQAKGNADRERMLKEVYALAALSDQADTATFHIVRYHQAWMEDGRLYIQTELCSGTLAGEMAAMALATSMPLPEQRRYKVLREMLLALDFIHRQHNMVHLDIKPDNIFLKNDQYKLGDFGLVTLSRAASCSGDHPNSHQEVEEGDSRYMSVELLSAGDPSSSGVDLTKSDIFSLGATLYEICLHRPLPMNGPEWHDIRSGRLVGLINNPHTSSELALIITQMMHPVAASRPTASQLLQHPQLLSDEQKALNAEKGLVMALQLAAAGQQQQQHNPQYHQQQPQRFHNFPPPTVPPPRRGLMRSNTWSGSASLQYL